jgi:hypothetical protein
MTHRFERPLHGSQFVDSSVRSGSAATVRRQWEQSLAGHRRRVADPPMHPAAERQVPRYSGQPPDELANVRYRRPPTLAGQIRTAADSLKLLFDSARRWAATQRLRSVASGRPTHGLGAIAVIEPASLQRRQRPVSKVLLT